LANFWQKQLKASPNKEERTRNLFFNLHKKNLPFRKVHKTQISKGYQKYSSSVTSKSLRLEEVYYRSQILLPIFLQIIQHMEISRQEKNRYHPRKLEACNSGTITKNKFP